jgi:FkbM family methyltransferase
VARAGISISTYTRRAIRSSALLTMLVKSGPGRWAIQTERAARLVTPVQRFLIGQAIRRNAVGSYRLRASGAVVHLRHATRDVDILNEVFGVSGGALSYEPPAEISDVLDDRRIAVLDLGGNIGLFGLYALHRWDVESLTSFEPDPANSTLLRATIAANGDQSKWQLEQAAVSNAHGRLPFRAGLFAEARAARNGEPAVEVPMVDFFERGKPVDLLKVDIEGGEWAILTDARFEHVAARAIVIEWHEEGCPETDAHAAILGLLARAGYRVVKDDPAEHGGNGVLWALR